MTLIGNLVLQNHGSDGVVIADDSTGQRVVLPAHLVGDAASTLQYFYDCNQESPVARLQWLERPANLDPPVYIARPGDQPLPVPPDVWPGG